MTLLSFIHTDLDRSKRTSTPAMRPMTAEIRSHPWQSRVSSVADPDCIRLDICRWETEGGALIGDKLPPAAVLHRKSNLQTNSQNYATD